MRQATSPRSLGLPLIPAKAGIQRWVPAFAGTSGLLVAVFLSVLMSVQPAAADFRLCNNTASRVGVAVGYKDSEGWTTEGWWNLPSRTCETVLKGNLVARFYYVYAIDYDHGGEWTGRAYMCTRDKEFTIRGIGDCLAHGYDRTGFFEVDTGEQRAWTVQLTESSEQQPGQRVPGIPGTVDPNKPGGLPGISPGGAPGLPASPGGTPPGTPGSPPAAAPGSKP